MKQRLCIAIQHLTPSWRAILNQVGLWFEEVDYSASLPASYSLIILNKQPDKAQIQLLRDYLSTGGSVLEINDCMVFNDKNSIRPKRVKRLINHSEHKAFQHISFIDLYDRIRVHKKSSLLNGLVHFESVKKGNLGFFGADVSELIKSSDHIRKRFYSPDKKYPSEIVSKVSKHTLMNAFESVLKELHFLQSKPFIQKWISPSQKPVFCFRIDSDFGNRESINELYSALNEHNIPGTWFLHVEAHESWLDLFHTFKNQEIALHGYEHGTSKSVAKTQENIRLGKYLLEMAGFNVTGYCAPYGIWNKALIKALKVFEFKYTSEFTHSYDGCPISPIQPHLPLQIPIHPICTGSLKRQHLKKEEMSTYFKSILQQKAGRFEPAIFYHHPLQPGLESVINLFKQVNTLGLKKMTFNDFADFWDSRQKQRFHAVLENDRIILSENYEPELFLQVSKNHQEFYLVKGSESEIDLSKTAEFKFSNHYLPDANEAAEMNTNDLRLMKTSLFDWKNRIRL
ncbi:MAG: polysaccharide deacetylase family protein [Gracilimonas sp.]